MRSNREIRDEARGLLRKTPWGWRVLWVGILVGIVAGLVTDALAVGFGKAGVQTWADYSYAAFRARRSGLDMAIPSLRVGAYMVAATAFASFIRLIFTGIQTFATSSVTLCAVTDGCSANWFKPSLAGFGRPFGMFSLMFFWTLRITWWLYLGGIVIGVGAGVLNGLHWMSPSAFIATAWGWYRDTDTLLHRLSPSAFIAAAVVIVCVCISLTVIAAYRYRFVWFVKVCHPDWGANRCLNETRRLMEGKKWASFRLDCAYWKPIAVWLAGLFVFTVLLVGAQLLEFVILGLAALISFLVLFCFGVYLALYLNFGQAILFRDLMTEAE